MSTFSKHILSGSTNGRPIECSTAGAVIHTAGAGTGTIDEIYVWALNTASADINVSIKLGATTTASTYIETITPKAGLQMVVPGLPLNNALAVTAYATGSVKCVGYVNRIAT